MSLDVETAMPVARPYKLASRDPHRPDTVVQVGRVSIGGPRLVVMAGIDPSGPEAAVIDGAQRLRASGADMLHVNRRGAGAGGLGDDEPVGPPLHRLATLRLETGLPIVAQVLTASDVELAARHLDMLRIDTHHMQDYALLREAGRCGRPVLLERGFASTVEEWLLAAEYVLCEGNPDVVLCERGIRTSEPTIPFTLDLNAMVRAEELTHLPLVADPTQGATSAKLVHRLSLAAAAAGATGLMLQVRPACAGAQEALPLLGMAGFRCLVDDLRLLTGPLARCSAETARRL